MPNRTTVLAVAALVLVGVGAGAVVLVQPFADEDRAIEQVPGGVDVLVSVDGSAITDTRTLALVSAVESDLTGPDNETLAGLTGTTRDGPDPTAIDELLFFSRHGSPGYDGAVVHADWSTGTVVALAANGTDYEATTVNGTELHGPATPTGNATWVAVVGDGEYVLGSRSVVEDAVAVDAGTRPGFNGTLRKRYETTREGSIRFVANGSRTPFANVDRRVLRENVTSVAGSYYTNSSAVGAQLRIRAPSATDARTVRDVIRASISLTNATASRENVSAALSAVAVRREGRTVVVELSTTLDRAKALLVYLESRRAGPETSVPALSDLGR